jgi:hypothetical protein
VHSSSHKSLVLLLCRPACASRGGRGQGRHRRSVQEPVAAAAQGPGSRPQRAGPSRLRSACRMAGFVVARQTGACQCRQMRVRVVRCACVYRQWRQMRVSVIRCASVCRQWRQMRVSVIRCASVYRQCHQMRVRVIRCASVSSDARPSDAPQHHMSSDALLCCGISSGTSAPAARQRSSRLVGYVQARGVCPLYRLVVCTGSWCVSPQGGAPALIAARGCRPAEKDGTCA